MRLPQTLIKLIKDTIGEPEVGAEIGVYKGITSKALLETFPNLELIMVDPWKEWVEGDSYHKHRRTGKLTQEEWNEIYNTALDNVKPYTFVDDLRARIYRGTSLETIRYYENRSLDFAFLDGDHTEKMVDQDIELLLPKVRKGGLLVFHDYGGHYRGVKKAVNKVFGIQDLILPGNRVCGVIINES